MKKNIAIITFLVFIQFNAFSQSATDTIIYNLGMQFDSAFSVLDKTFFEEFFDADAFTKKFITQNSGNEKIEEFNRSINIGVQQGFINKIMETLENGGSYNFINYSQDEETGQYFLLIRFLSEDGLNYHQYSLIEKDGSYKADDIFVFMSGENLSETIGRIYKTGIYSISGEGFQSEMDSIYFNSVIALNRIKQLNEMGATKLARKQFDEIPDELKMEKLFILYEIQLLESLEEGKYKELLDRYALLYPDDISIFLISFDKFFLEEKYDEAFSMVDSIYAYTGDDLLDFYKGNILFSKGNLKDAEFHFKRTIENYPYYIDAYDALFYIYIEEKRYNDIISIFNSIVSLFDVDPKLLIEDTKSEYPDFYKSGEFKKWKKQHK